MRKKNIYTRKKQKRINTKKVTVVIGGVIVVVAAVFGIIKFKGNTSEEESVRDSKLANSTITSIVSNASEEINKGPTRSAGKVAYITIDDGPSKFTDQLIKVLDKHNAKGTFFMIDGNMKAYPEQVKNIVNSGNTGGFHSVTHDIHKLYTTPTSAKEEFDQCAKTFYDITGKRSKVIRIPYGSKPYTPQASYDAMVSSGYKIWDWDLDTMDWKANSTQIVDSVKNHNPSNDKLIILIHEKQQSLDALDPMLTYLANEGYEFQPIEQNQTPHNYWLNNLK
ncbi:polysaccharide deacetylase [Clostridioides mangenotii]|uniref:polysaccharide deacetylase family protein n=1 Tax=Metaclostridioides mangenotii TaxID=1540 RepID=UPI001C103F82|nr:polysaccharide deacetylase family protein [Clostridioides mangenotii]MBU5306353.1 polysaccharide deacetylase [Clostridioides mangenotii]MCR1955920.1 polysaccharide deacetylase [Clostridioides mangenotii]